MKCTVCHALLCPGDEICVSCGATLTTVRRAEASAHMPATPAWAYVLAALCAGIPVASLGGAYASVLGLVAAVLCIVVARMQNVAGYVRLSVCLGITMLAWLIFLTIVVELMPKVRRNFYDMFQ